MTLAAPTISVVVPLFNGERFIEQALRSVAAQTIGPHEIIVVDDGSSDCGCQIVETFARTIPLHLVHKSNGGQSSARKLGVKLSTGSHIAFLDQDDLWYPDHLEALLRPFIDNPALPIGWTYSNLDEISEAGNLVARNVLNRSTVTHPKTDLLSCIRQDMLILPSASLIAKVAFDAVGGFDEQLSGYEDDDLFVRLFQAGYQNVYIDKALSQWRIYGGSESYSARMARSRVAYARKLVETFPDDAFRNIYYARDLIVPRFFHEVVENLRRALRAGDSELADTCREHMGMLAEMAGARRHVSVYQNDPIVTVVILLDDGKDTIQAALESIRTQRLPPDEVIVVDSGSTAHGLATQFAVQHSITLLAKPQAARAEALNLGIAHSHGDLIAFLTGDSLWHPDHLLELSKTFRVGRDGSIGWAHCGVEDINILGDVLTRSTPPYRGAAGSGLALQHALPFAVSAPASAIMVSREAFHAVGGFDASLSGFEEDDLFTRLLNAGYSNAFVEQPRVQRRLPQKAQPNPIDVANARIACVRKLAGTISARTTDTRFPGDLIVPRFLDSAIQNLRHALRQRDLPLAGLCRQEIVLLESLAQSPDGGRTLRSELLISVVIPLYNGASTIEEALTSVLTQTRQPDEIIVVDDGSTDLGADIVVRLAETYPIRLLRQANAGQSAARNFGIRHAHGDLIALLDQDDAWYPSHLAELTVPFAQPRAKPLGWAYSNLDEVDRYGALVASAVLNRSGTEHPKSSLIDALRRDMFILPSATVLSRAAFEAVGGFDERLLGYEDDDLFIRLLQAGYDNVYIPAPLSRWRVCSDSASFSPRMARSRMIFARKLIETFPDEPARNMFYARDLLLPRFRYHVAENLRRALHANNLELAERCADDLRELADWIKCSGESPRQRDNLLLSVVLVADGDPDRTEMALRSVLAQSCRPDEVVIVDREEAEPGRRASPLQYGNARIRLVTAAGASVPAARNIGVRHVYGDLVAFLDTNREWYPDHLAELASCFRKPGALKLGWAYGDFDEIDAHGRLTAQSVLQSTEALRVRTSLQDCLSERAPIDMSGSLLSRDALNLVGGFDEDLGHYTDLDLFIRLLQGGYGNVVVARTLSRRPAKPDVPPEETPQNALCFARKLIAALPPLSEDRGIVARRMIASALVDDVLACARHALRQQDAERIDACLSVLDSFDPWLTRGTDDLLPARPLLISVIIPLYNGAPYIDEAIDSIFSQTLEPDEVIVVDDGSTDGGADIVEERARNLPIRLIRRPNGGQSAARNTGVEYARGDLIAFLDQDDTWYPTHLAELVKPFLAADQRNVGWSYSDLDEVNEAGEMVCRGLIRSHHRTGHPKLDLVTCLRNDMFILPSATLIARKAFLRIGGFNERLSGYEDDDLFLRLFRAGFQCAFLEQPLSTWRMHESSGSYSPRMAISRLAYARILIERFPDEPARALYYVRDLIAPRFLRSMSADFRRCVLTGDYQQQTVLLGHLAFIVRYLRMRWRLPLQFIIIPALNVPLIARLVAPKRLPMMRVFRDMI